MPSRASKGNSRSAQNSAGADTASQRSKRLCGSTRGPVSRARIAPQPQASSPATPRDARASEKAVAPVFKRTSRRYWGGRAPGTMARIGERDASVAGVPAPRNYPRRHPSAGTPRPAPQGRHPKAGTPATSLTMSGYSFCAIPAVEKNAGSARAVINSVIDRRRSGTSVPFSKAQTACNLLGEQFWGRAARASQLERVGPPVNF